MPISTAVTPKGDLSSTLPSLSELFATGFPNSNGLGERSTLVLSAARSVFPDLGTSNVSRRFFLTVVTLKGWEESLSVGDSSS